MRLPPAAPKDVVQVSTRLYVLIPDALKSLSYRVMNSDDPVLRQKLIKDFSVTATSGTAPLTTPLTASEPMIWEGLSKSTMMHSSSVYPFQHLPDRTSLIIDRPRFGLIYDWVDGSTLRTKDTSGSLTGLTGTVTISGSYIPVITTVSGNADLEEMLVEDLTRIAVTAKKADE